MPHFRRLGAALLAVVLLVTAASFVALSNRGGRSIRRQHQQQPGRGLDAGLSQARARHAEARLVGVPAPAPGGAAAQPVAAWPKSEASPYSVGSTSTSRHAVSPGSGARRSAAAATAAMFSARAQALMQAQAAQLPRMPQQQQATFAHQEPPLAPVPAAGAASPAPPRAPQGTEFLQPVPQAPDVDSPMRSASASDAHAAPVGDERQEPMPAAAPPAHAVDEQENRRNVLAAPLSLRLSPPGKCSYKLDTRKPSAIRVWPDKAIAPPFDWTTSQHSKYRHVLQMVHIQKTGGKYFEHAWLSLMQPPTTADGKPVNVHVGCRKTNSWEFGIHASLARIANNLHRRRRSVDRLLTGPRYGGDETKDQQFVITLLRDPMARLASEFLHNSSVSLSGWTWNDGVDFVRGDPAASKRLVIPIASDEKCDRGRPSRPPSMTCYQRLCRKHRGAGTCLPRSGDGILQYIECPANQGLNRMTRMLASPLCVVKGAAEQEERWGCMLETAKRNLVRIPFFALAEFMAESQALAEWTFGVGFKEPWQASTRTATRDFVATMPPRVLEAVRHANRFDEDLYEFARYVFARRLTAAGIHV